MIRPIPIPGRVGGTVLAVVLLLVTDWTWKASVMVSAYRGYVCTPHNITPITDCTKEHWIRISSKFYAPKQLDLDASSSSSSSSCDLNTTVCNNYVHNTGLAAICNGPVVNESNPCQEWVDFDAERASVDCLKNAEDLAAIVDYSCITSTSVIDMCSNTTHSQTSSTLYLASPGFPNSPADGQMCSCSIQGSRIKLEVIDLNVRTHLLWDEPSSIGGLDAVLYMESNDTIVWSSNSQCTNCDRIRLYNTNLYFPTTAGFLADVSLFYSDFGLPGQNVWLRLFNLGARINVTCSSSPLATNRIITTTTTTTTTPATTITTPATTTTTPATTTTTPAATTTTTTEKTTKEITKPAGAVETTTTTPMSSDTSTPNSGPPGSPGKGKSSDEGDEGNDAVLVVVLVLVLIALVTITSILFVVIYRRRDKFGSIDLRSALLSWVERTFHRQRNSGYAESEENDDYQLHTFENVAYGLPPGDNQESNHSSEDVYSVPHKPGKKQETHVIPTAAAAVEAESEQMATDSTATVHNTTSMNSLVESSTPAPLVDSAMYVSHQQLVEQEVARIKMERSLHAKNKTGNKSNENVNDVNLNDNGDDDNKVKSSHSKQGKNPESASKSLVKTKHKNMTTQMSDDNNIDVSSSNSSAMSAGVENEKKDRITKIPGPTDKMHYEQVNPGKLTLSQTHDDGKVSDNKELKRSSFRTSKKEKLSDTQKIKNGHGEGQLFKALGMSQSPPSHSDAVERVRDSVSETVNHADTQDTTNDASVITFPSEREMNTRSHNVEGERNDDKYTEV